MSDVTTSHKGLHATFYSHVQELIKITPFTTAGRRYVEEWIEQTLSVVNEKVGYLQPLPQIGLFIHARKVERQYRERLAARAEELLSEFKLWRECGIVTDDPSSLDRLEKVLSVLSSVYIH